MSLNAWQPGKVLSGLNASQSEIVTEFPLKDSFKRLHDPFVLKSCEMWSDLKNYVRLPDNKVSELGDIVKLACA